MPTSIKPKFPVLLFFKLGFVSKSLHSIFEKYTTVSYRIAYFYANCFWKY